jgi:hypothetical protein
MAQPGAASSPLPPANPQADQTEARPGNNMGAYAPGLPATGPTTVGATSPMDAADGRAQQVSHSGHQPQRDPGQTGQN